MQANVILKYAEIYRELPGCSVRIRELPGYSVRISELPLCSVRISEIPGCAGMCRDVPGSYSDKSQQVTRRNICNRLYDEILKTKF